LQDLHDTYLQLGKLDLNQYPKGKVTLALKEEHELNMSFQLAAAASAHIAGLCLTAASVVQKQHIDRQSVCMAYTDVLMTWHEKCGYQAVD